MDNPSAVRLDGENIEVGALIAALVATRSGYLLRVILTDYTQHLDRNSRATVAPWPATLDAKPFQAASHREAIDMVPDILKCHDMEVVSTDIHHQGVITVFTVKHLGDNGTACALSFERNNCPSCDWKDRAGTCLYRELEPRPEPGRSGRLLGRIRRNP